MGLQLTDKRRPSDPGYFRIGAVTLSIPPEAITINRNANNQEVTTLRSGTPYYKKTGHQRLDVIVSWKAVALPNSSNPYQQWRDVRTVLAYLKCAPFVEVENAHIRQFVMSAELGYADTDRMAFAIQSMKVETVPDLSDTLQVTLYLTWFNYLPYTLNFAYTGVNDTDVSAQNSTKFKAYVDQWMRPNLPDNSVWERQDDSKFRLNWRRYISFRMPTDLVQKGSIFKQAQETAASSSKPSSDKTIKPAKIAADKTKLLYDLAWMAVVAENSTPGSDVGVPADFSVAQRLAEYGFREKTPHNNAFGINASNNYKGKTAVVNATHGSSGQYKSPTLMRAYDGEQEAFVDHASLIANDRNYRAVWQAFVASDRSQASVEQLAAGVMVKYSEDTKKLSNVLSFMRNADLQRAVQHQRGVYASSHKNIQSPPTPAKAAGTDEQKPQPTETIRAEASSSPNNDHRDALIDPVIKIFEAEGWKFDHRTESDLYFYQPQAIDLFSGYDSELPINRAGIVPTQITVFFQNNMARLPLENQIFPTMQHIGSPGSLVTVNFNSIGDDSGGEPEHRQCTQLNDMMAKLESQFHDMRGRWRAASRVHRMQCAEVESNVLNMLGIDFVIPHQLGTETIPDSPNMISAQLVMSQYKNRYEAVDGFLIKDPSWKKLKVVSDVVTGESWNAIPGSTRSTDLRVLGDFRDRASANRRDASGKVVGPDITLLTNAVAGGWEPPTVNLNFNVSDPANRHVHDIAVKIALFLEQNNQQTTVVSGFVAKVTSGLKSTAVPSLVSRLRSDSWSYTDYIWIMSLPTSGPRLYVPQELKNALAVAVGTKINQVATAGGGMADEGTPSSNPFFTLRDELLRYKFERDPEWAKAIQVLSVDDNLRERLWAADEIHTPSDDQANSAHLCYTDLGIKNLRIDPDCYFKNYGNEMRRKVIENAAYGAKLVEGSNKDLNEVHFGNGSSNAAATAGNASEANTADADRVVNDYTAIMTEKINPPRVSMSRAFPTYKILLIEEDNDGPYYCFDDFYTYNSVVNIEVARYADKPDIARIQLTNFSNILKHKFYNGTTLSKIEMKDHEYEHAHVPSATDEAGKPLYATNPDAPRQATLGYEDRLTGVNNFGNDEFQPHFYYALQTGSKIQVRMGYSNDPDKLWPVFNGVVTEIEEGDIMTLICQGYMVELMNEVLPGDSEYEHDSNFKFYQTIKGEVDKVMEKMIQGPFAKHFGGRKVFRGSADVLSTLGYHPLSSAIRATKPSDPMVSAILSYLTNRSNRASENIFINRFLTTGGELSPQQQVNNRMSTRPLYLTAPTAFSWSVGSFHVPENIPHLTPWKVMKCASRFWPEYNLHVKNYGFPFQADATLVFGDPSDYFYARQRNASEGNGIGSFHPRMDPAFQSWWNAVGKGQTEGILRVLNTGQTRQRFMDSYLELLWGLQTTGELHRGFFNYTEDTMVRETLDSVGDVKSFEKLIKNFLRVKNYGQGVSDGENNWAENVIISARGKFQDIVHDLGGTRDKWDILTQSMMSLDKSFRSFMQFYMDPEHRKWSAGQSMMPVQKWHVVTSAHIISNSIALNDKVYNAVRIDTKGIGKAPEVMKANASIPGEEIRLIDVTDQIIAPEDNLKSDNLWRLQAQSFIREELGKMYRGELVILGQPEIEPGDVVHLADSVRDMFGPVEVESVIHAFDERDGMITIIRPRALVLINQATGAGITYAISQFFFGGGASGDIQGFTAGLTDMTSGAKTGAVALGTLSSATAAHATAAAIAFGRKASAKLMTKGVASAGAARLAGYVIPGVNILMGAWTGYELVHGAISLALDHTAMHPVFLVPLTRYNKPWMSGVARWSMGNMGYTLSQKWQRMWDQEVASSMEGLQAFASDQKQMFYNRIKQ
jgi:hypothetical protein